MKTLLFIFLFATIQVSAQQIIPLYEGVTPGSENWNYKEIEYTNPGNGKKMIRNVVKPTLEVFLPEKSEANGSAVVVCPGGGFVWLSYQSEGTEVAEWLAQNGVAAFVLKYRLNHTPEGDEEFGEFITAFFSRMMGSSTENEEEEFSGIQETDRTILAGQDGLKAVEYVRKYAADYNINPDKVGIMGFSAGAAVTMDVILNSSPENQPNFAAPVYGGWLGDSEVPENAPPLFVLAAADDAISARCPDLFKAWRDAGLPAELHIYSQGGHGFGMDKNDLPVDSWIERFYDWLELTVIKK